MNERIRPVSGFYNGEGKSPLKIRLVRPSLFQVPGNTIELTDRVK
jgi:hypothetical protein